MEIADLYSSMQSDFVPFLLVSTHFLKNSTYFSLILSKYFLWPLSNSSNFCFIYLELYSFNFGNKLGNDSFLISLSFLQFYTTFILVLRRNKFGSGFVKHSRIYYNLKLYKATLSRDSKWIWVMKVPQQ